MAYKHSAFLFDYRNFLISSSSIVSSLDAGDDTLLREHAFRIQEKIGERNWILANDGTSIGNLGWDQDSKHKHGLWGHWLLLILSEFLASCASLEYEWTELSQLLHNLRWDDEDIWRLLTGIPTAQIIKPKEKFRRDVPIKWSDPYWAWIRPERSIYSGWLPEAEINRLSNKLNRISINANQVNNGSFDLANEMINNAKRKSLGLYFVVFEDDDPVG